MVFLKAFISDHHGWYSTVLLNEINIDASSATEAQVDVLVASLTQCDTWHSPTWGQRACGWSKSRLMYTTLWICVFLWNRHHSRCLHSMVFVFLLNVSYNFLKMVKTRSAQSIYKPEFLHPAPCYLYKWYFWLCPL